MTDALLAPQCTFEREAPGLYVRSCDRTWWGHEALFGGYVQALALEAMALELGDDSMLPSSMSIQFFRPYGEGDTRVEAEVLRRGRSMASTRALLHSGGKLAGSAIASFGVRRRVAEFVAVDPPPGLDRPVAVDEEPHPAILGVPCHQWFDFFPRLGRFALGSGETFVGGWVRTRRPEAVDALLMCVLADLWVPAAYHRWTEPAVAVSADITAHFRAPVPTGRGEVPAPYPPGTPLFVTLRTSASAGGFVDEDAEIWSPDGVLLAQSRQQRFVHS
jgi:acyl-CoA thioesterase